jgi:RNA polymerase primary sigma factor
MKILDKLSRILGSRDQPMSEPEIQFLNPFEIRLIAEGKLEKLADFAASVRLRATDPKGDTPLHLAARMGNLALCDLFIRSGADPDALNHERQTPADVAHAEGHRLASQLLSSLVTNSREFESLEAREESPILETTADMIEAIPPTHLSVVNETGPDDVVWRRQERNADTSWTDDRIELLTRMWFEGQSANQISRELGGVSRNAVLSKALRLGLWEKEGAETSSSETTSEIPPNVAAQPSAGPEQRPSPEIAQTAAAPNQLDDLDDLLGFEAEEEPEEFFGESASETVSGTFVALVSPAPVVSDDEDGDWDIDLSPASIAGEGIGAAAAVTTDHGAEHDFLKVRNRGRQSVKRAVVQTGTRLSIDPEICITWAEETLAKGWCSFSDIESIVALCEGNGDLEELRTNLLRNVEAAGFDPVDSSSAHIVGLWDARSDISSDELAEAIEAALTRSRRLPGTQRFVMDKSDELQLLEPMVRAKQELQLGILASEAAVQTILDVVDSIGGGVRDPGSVSLKTIIPSRPGHAETAEVMAAAEALKFWQANGRVLDGKRRRQALAALESLDLSLAFHKELVSSLEQSNANPEHANWLDTQISVFEAANERLIHEHLPYVRRFAARNVEEGEDPEDVFQVAFMGLQRSTRRFDPERGYRFVVYASYWMRQAIMRWRADEGAAIRIPVHRKEKIARLDLALERLDVRADGIVSDSDLAIELEWTTDEVSQFRSIPRTAEYPESIDDWDEVLPEQEDANAFDQAENERIIIDALAELPEREADIIRMRFGIDRDSDMTLEEIGQIYGVTRERIRQIEAKGLDRLSHPGRKRRLQELLGYDSSRGLKGPSVQHTEKDGASETDNSKRQLMSWTRYRVARLEELWAAGMSASEIAEELGGTSRNAVIGKLSRLGLADSGREQRQ